LVYELTRTHGESQFSPQMVLRILNICVLVFVVVSVVWSVCVLGSFFLFVLVLICGLVQVLFLSLIVNISVAIFLILHLD